MMQDTRIRNDDFVDTRSRTQCSDGRTGPGLGGTFAGFGINRNGGSSAALPVAGVRSLTPLLVLLLVLVTKLGVSSLHHRYHLH